MKRAYDYPLTKKEMLMYKKKHGVELDFYTAINHFIVVSKRLHNKHFNL